jgi:CRISPR-associated protein Cas2
MNSGKNLINQVCTKLGIYQNMDTSIYYSFLIKKMLYLVCYDIVKDSRRTKVSDLLESYGLRVQKSVFEIMIDDIEYLKLQDKLQRLVNQKEDQIRFYPLSKTARKKTLILGFKPDLAVDNIAFIV